MQYKNIFPVMLYGFLTVLSNGCQEKASGNTGNEKAPSAVAATTTPYTMSPEWSQYWYQGKAELTSYDLQQSRYGEIHSGTVVNIFVTEDFSKEKQVKLDDPSSAGADKLPVLKLNQSIKFVTGIYPYSLMMSAFQPVDINTYPHAVKITESMQEWCGMAYYQMNNRNNQFDIEQRSYFESEGDKEVSIKPVVQEDELWNMIRIDPTHLPTGDIDILPGALYLRLSHKPLEPVKAKCTLSALGTINTYLITMPSLNRTLAIHFENAFPYKINGWEDTYPGIDGKVLTTTAVRNKSLMIDYWRTHTNADRALRVELGIPKDTQ